MNVVITDLASQLRRDEGEVLHAYQDHLSFWTIGVGHLIDERKGGGISKAVSGLLLAGDINQVQKQLDQWLPWWRGLDDIRGAVLCNMAFQLGIGGLLKFKQTLRFVGRSDWPAAAEEMLDSTWAKQTPERAERLAKQMLTGQWQ